MKMSEKETMKSEIIKYAMSKIGTKRVSTLDGMTLEYKNKYYNIYVDDNNVTVEEIDDLDEYKEISDRKESTGRDRINLMETHSFPSISDMYNDKCFCCVADRKGNECKGKETCGKTWKRYEAIINPEWHHVSLATLANIDFDMLDEKRKVYLSFYKKWQEVRKNLRKCSCGYSYDRCRNVFRRSLTIALDKKKISKELVNYFDRQISMVNVECGVWSSAVEVATGEHESRKYNRPTLRY